MKCNFDKFTYHLKKKFYEKQELALSVSLYFDGSGRSPKSRLPCPYPLEIKSSFRMQHMRLVQPPTPRLRTKKDPVNCNIHDTSRQPRFTCNNCYPIVFQINEIDRYFIIKNIYYKNYRISKIFPTIAQRCDHLPFRLQLKFLTS